MNERAHLVDFLTLTLTLTLSLSLTLTLTLTLMSFFQSLNTLRLA